MRWVQEQGRWRLDGAPGTTITSTRRVYTLGETVGGGGFGVAVAAVDAIGRFPLQSRVDVGEMIPCGLKNWAVSRFA